MNQMCMAPGLRSRELSLFLMNLCEDIILSFKFNSIVKAFIQCMPARCMHKIQIRRMSFAKSHLSVKCIVGLLDIQDIYLKVRQKVRDKLL